jgi:hypothetical protein
VSFTAAWLALREPYDARARNGDVVSAVVSTFADVPSMAVVDLACGTGSTMHAVHARLRPRQTWRLVDNNLSLLARAADTAPPTVTVQATPLDLARDLELALDGAVDLVTTSALLDLVSDEWLERFATETAARRLPVYAALTYDGRAKLDPADPFDEKIVGAMNRHQRREKGFGPALGPAAAGAAIARFEALGYGLVHGPADWAFETSDRQIQQEVLAGWASAAQEIGGLALPEIVSWLTRRRDLIAAGRSRIRVGHVDFFAWPTGTR